MRKPSFLILILFAAVTACGSRQDLHVTSIQLGRSQNADRTVAGYTTGFSSHDTVYLSVLTAGAGNATIGVRWTYAGRLLDEPKKQVSYRDVAVTDFSLQSAGGFPPGDYTAEVFFNGQSVETRAFRVR